MPTIKTRRSGVDIRTILPKPRATGSKTSRTSHGKPPPPPPARTKKIEDHSMEELDAAIETAVGKFGSDFWLMLHGIDSYMERRKRLRADRNNRLMKSAMSVLKNSNWGDQ